MASNIPHKNWLIRYKIYHLPFWFLYHCMWWAITVGSISSVTNNILLFSPYSLKFLFYVVFQAAAVYFNLYFLIPRVLEKGKYVQYIICVILTIVVAASIIVLGYYTSAWAAGIPFRELYGRDPDDYIYFFKINSLPSTAASMTLAMSVKLTKNWIQTKKREKLLEKEKLETELNFLRSQFNPHFLFNTINSIFFLIHKNPDKASEALAKFSDLLRYQLYECNDKQIPLGNEIAYIENFIELEKLRQNDNVKVTFTLNQRHPKHLFVAPFILMTFVENAFKHVSKDNGQPNWINIELNLSGSQLDFSVSNSTCPDEAKDIIHYGGIGLKNVQRRLDLIYPGEYELLIEKKADRFDVQLQLKIPELQPQQEVQQINEQPQLVLTPIQR